MRNCARAFTMIELIAVVVVLAVLSGVAVGKFYDYRQRALKSSEEGTAGAVRAAIGQYITTNALTGNGKPPASLDTAAAGATADLGTPLFGAVLREGVTTGWKKGSAPNLYIGPAGTTFAYDSTTGAFTSDAAAVAAATTPAPSGSTNLTLVNATKWKADAPGSADLGPGTIVGAGYTLNGSVIELTESSKNFNEAARRTAITGMDISAGNFELSLDTRLTDYWTQLNYWQVYLVKSGTELNLSGNALNWGTAPAGAKLVTRDYAPENKSDGSWYSYTNSFSVSAADAAAYDQIVVVMAGSKGESQTLSWQNVAITKK